MTLPFENNTSRAVKRLAKRSLQSDRRRNLFVVLTIALAVCLMAVCGFMIYAQKAKTLAMIQGQYQSGCNHLSYEDINRLVGEGQFEKWGYETDRNAVRYQESNIIVKFADPNMRDLLSVDRISGGYPQAENEICVERAFLEFYGFPQKTGQTIAMDAGFGQKEYVVTGILEKENYSNQYDAYISEAEVAAYGGEKPFTLRFRFAGGQMEQPKALREDIESFYKRMDIPESQTFYSSNYFDMTGLYLGDDTMMLFGVAALIATACSVVIYSIFYISVMGKIHEYGRLKVIGATSKQLGRVVKRERRFLTFVGIPTGLLAAALITNLLMPGYWGWEKNLKYGAAIAVWTYFVVLLSTRKPLKLVEKVAAIEAVRTTAYAQLGPEHSKRLHRRVTMFRLAALNFSRSRKKSVLTLFSLGLTGIMAISAGAYANSIDAGEMARAGFGDQSEYRLTLEKYGDEMVEAQRKNPLDQELRMQLVGLPEVDHIITYSAACAIVEQVSNQDEAFFIDGYTAEQMEEQLPPSAFQEGAASYDSLLENDGILFVRTSDNIFSQLYHTDFAVGDPVTFKCYNGRSKTYKVMGVVDDVNRVMSTDFFILPEEELHVLYPEIDDFTKYVNIHGAKDSLQLRQSIFALVSDPDVAISSVEDYKKELKTSLQFVLRACYGLVAFISLFALLNLVNTMMTNLLARQQEFGILQSVGLTKKQLFWLLFNECLIYTGVTVAITLTVGTACSVALCRLFDSLGLFGRITYHFPTAQMLVFAAALLIIQTVFAATAVWFSKRHSMVELIKAKD